MNTGFNATTDQKNSSSLIAEHTTTIKRIENDIQWLIDMINDLSPKLQQEKFEQNAETTKQILDEQKRKDKNRKKKDKKKAKQRNKLNNFLADSSK